MASTIRYDFSFPPKSSALNHQSVANNGSAMATSNQTSHTGASLVGLARSASSSLLTSAHTINAHNENNNSHYCVNHNNNCIVRAPNGTTICQPYHQTHSHSHSHNLLTHSITLNALSLNAPTTPRDANCSFTFDELKNTLAFMEDSPLVNAATHSSSSNSSSSNSTNATSNTNMLMVEPTINTNDCGASVSSLSSASSSSSANSSGSSCATCTYPGSLMPKSNSTNQIHLSSSCMCASTANDTLINSGSNSGSLSSLQSQSNGIAEPLLIKKSPKGGDSHPSKPHALNNSSSVNSFPGQQQVTSQNLLQPVQVQNGQVPNLAIESAAKQYRCAAQNSEASCAWKGKLPPKQYKTPIVYSTKVFVGGLPWDITEDDLIKEFGQFGPCRVEWTNKEKYNLLANGETSGNGMGKNSQFRNYRSVGCLNGKQQDPISSSKQRSSPGFAYVIYDHEYSVRSLVGNCIEDYANGRDRVEYYFKISTRRVRNKEVQIIPWILADNNFALCTPKELDPKKTVFVGNLHGTITARDLAHIMNELFGCVVYAGIDIDKLKYPIGSGRVTFSHQQNFIRAVRAAFVDIQTPKFAKRIQIDPYLEDVHCCVCFNEKGIYFCRDFQCYNYYCGPCWQKQHSFEMMGNHKPLMRKREEKV